MNDMKNVINDRELIDLITYERITPTNGVSVEQKLYVDNRLDVIFTELAEIYDEEIMDE